jgi:hypothetical protein
MEMLLHTLPKSLPPPPFLTTPPDTSTLPSNNCKIPYVTYPLLLPCLSLSNPNETLCYSSTPIFSLFPFPTLLTPHFFTYPLLLPPLVTSHSCPFFVTPAPYLVTSPILPLRTCANPLFSLTPF